LIARDDQAAAPVFFILEFQLPGFEKIRPSCALRSVETPSEPRTQTSDQALPSLQKQSRRSRNFWFDDLQPTFSGPFLEQLHLLVGWGNSICVKQRPFP
jgi:hypothetical protein